MTNYLQISEAAVDTDFQVVNYAAADIPAYAVVVLDTANALSVNNIVDGIAAKVSNSATVLPIGLTMEIIRGTTYTGGSPGYGQCRAAGVGKAIASAAITAGVAVGNDTSGNGTIQTAPGGDPMLGVALSASTASGDEVAVLLSIARNA